MARVPRLKLPAGLRMPVYEVHSFAIEAKLGEEWFPKKEIAINRVICLDDGPGVVRADILGPNGFRQDAYTAPISLIYKKPTSVPTEEAVKKTMFLFESMIDFSIHSARRLREAEPASQVVAKLVDGLDRFFADALGLRSDPTKLRIPITMNINSGLLVTADTPVRVVLIGLEQRKQ